MRGNNVNNRDICYCGFRQSNYEGIMGQYLEEIEITNMDNGAIECETNHFSGMEMRWSKHGG